MTASSDLALTSRLLVEAFGESGPTSVPYLDWLYRQNPAGQPVQENLDDAEGRIGHYSVIPKLIGCGEESWRIGLSLNTAVASRAQGGGLFTRLASAVIERAKTEQLAGIVGVANANSTPGFVRRLGFTLEKPLPVKVGPALPARSSRLQSGDAALTLIARMEAQRRKDAMEFASPLWTEELLRWRMARPDARYFALAGEDGGVIGVKTVHGGLPFACLMGLFAPSPDARLGRLISAACAEAGAAFYVYAGWNRDIAIGGVPVPMRLRPSPLNLVWRDLSPSGQTAPNPTHFRRFEFIDFDAY